MKNVLNLKKFTVILLSIAILSIQSTGLFINAQSSDESSNDTYDYFTNSYTHLTDNNHVFKTVTYHELINLFESDGTYILLFGGSWCKNTQAVISQINDVAKEYGITRIYNFDTKLDTNKLHIRDTNNVYSKLYVDLVNKYLPNIVTLYDKAVSNISYNDLDGNPVIANKLQVPFLFVYNKNNKDTNGNSAPIISSLEKMLVWNDFLTNDAIDPVKVEAYKALVRPVFDPISKETSGKKIASFDIFDSYDYYSKAFNAAAGTTIFTESDKEIVFKTVTYNELTKILESDGKYVFLFGGAWCPNTRAVAKLINLYAKKYNIDTIYNFDTKLDGSSLHIRDTANPYANLYVDLVNKHFPDIITLYDKNDGKASHNISYTDASGNVIVSSKLQVPYLFTYDKNNKDPQGVSTPILGQLELMYTWANIQPDYTNAAGETGKNYQTYTTGLDNLFTSFYAANLKTLAIDADAKDALKDSYTQASYGVFKSSLDIAKGVILNLQASTLQIDEAYAGLNLAISNLIQISTVTDVNVSPLVSPTISSQLSTESAGNPSTGDVALLFPLISIFIISLAGIILLCEGSRRNKE